MRVSSLLLIRHYKRYAMPLRLLRLRMPMSPLLMALLFASRCFLRCARFHGDYAAA